MIGPKILLSLTAVLIALEGQSSASTLTLSQPFVGAFVHDSGGERIGPGLVLFGTFSATPAGTSIGEIDAAFEEFGSSAGLGGGIVGGSATNNSATPFDLDQIYLWIFDAPTKEAATEHGVFTVQDPNAPTTGNPWIFPTHNPSGVSRVIIKVEALTGGGEDTSITPGAVANQGGLFLTTIIPEPGASLLLGLGLVLIISRRRRRASNPR